MSMSVHVIKERREPRQAPRIQRASLGRPGRSSRFRHAREARGATIWRKLLMLPLLVVLSLVLVVTVISIASRSTAIYRVTLTNLSFQQDVQQRARTGALSSTGSTRGKQQATAGDARFTARASATLVRINQLDTHQYASLQQGNLWSPSTCSAASMTEIINAYNATYHRGPQYHIRDILQIENQLGEITPDLGMLHGATSISRTTSHFGFVSRDLSGLSLDDLLAVGNGGYPVIVNFPPDTWSGGHFLIVLGGDHTYVHLADSSRLNMQYMNRTKFQSYWEGSAVVAMPKSLQGQFQQFYAQLHNAGQQNTPKTANGAYSITGKPTLTAAFMNQVLASYHSPAAGKAQALYDLGVQYGIDPAFALAFFLHESTLGTQGTATFTHSLGNLRCIKNAACVNNIGDPCQPGDSCYAAFPSWEAGFQAWYALIQDGYIKGSINQAIGQNACPCTTITQIIPVYAPASDNNDEQAYIDSLKHSLDVWHAGQLRP